MMSRLISFMITFSVSALAVGKYEGRHVQIRGYTILFTSFRKYGIDPKTVKDQITSIVFLQDF